MKKFHSIIFWCEFPQKIQQNRMELIDFSTEVYVAAKNKKKYFYWKKRLQKRNVQIGALPTLPLRQGYWFSRYTATKDIDTLKEFDGINMKIDIEPPIPYTSMLFRKFSLYVLMKDSLREAWKYANDNIGYLWATIDTLKSKKVIISGFPFPNIVSRSYGDDAKRMRAHFYRNHFLYITFFRNKLLREIVMAYYSFYVRSKLKQYNPERLYFAIGCVGNGIFSTEPVYDNVKEFARDLDRFMNWGVRNLVVFNLEGILVRKDAEAWVAALKSRL